MNFALSKTAVGALLLLTVIVAFLTIPVPVRGQTEELATAERLNSQVLELYSAGRYNEAIPLAERALAIREKALGPEHPQTRRRA